MQPALCEERPRLVTIQRRNHKIPTKIKKKKLLRKASSDETQLLSCRSVILSAARRPAAVRLLEKALQRSELSDLSTNAKLNLIFS